MGNYTIIVQPTDGSGDHWLNTNAAPNADRFARWVHKTTGAPVSVFDNRRDRERLVLGAFDRERT